MFQDFRFVELLKIIFNFAISLKMVGNEKFVGSLNLDTFEVIASSDFLTRMSAQGYNQHILVAKKMLKLYDLVTVLVSLNGDDCWSECLAISCSDDVNAYMGTSEELQSSF